jgi:hypothetical protein
MVSAVLVLLAALPVASPPAPAIGVVRVARQDVSIARGVELQPARSGDLIRGKTVIETDQDGWAEIELLGAARLRISAATHIEIEKQDRWRLNLESGRVWIEHTAREHAFEIVTPNAIAQIQPASSAIVELDRASGTVVVVRAGEAMLSASTSNAPPEPIRIARGQIANVQTDAAHPTTVRSGGESLAEIVSLEAKTNLGDLIGVKAFLLARAAKTRVHRFGARGVQDIIRTDPEVTGGDSGPAGAQVEGGLRPPPFFENEVPPRGPNVKVKVTYGD